MAKTDMTKKSDKELQDIIADKRTEIQSERFKDKMSRKASILKGGRKEIARAKTEVTARLKANKTK